MAERAKMAAVEVDAENQLTLFKETTAQEDATRQNAFADTVSALSTQQAHCPTSMLLTTEYSCRPFSGKECGELRGSG